LTGALCFNTLHNVTLNPIKLCQKWNNKLHIWSKSTAGEIVSDAAAVRGGQQAAGSFSSDLKVQINVMNEDDETPNSKAISIDVPEDAPSRVHAAGLGSSCYRP